MSGASATLTKTTLSKLWTSKPIVLFSFSFQWNICYQQERNDGRVMRWDEQEINELN